MSRLASILALPLTLAAMPALAQYGGSYGPPAGAPPVNYGPYVAPAPFTGLRIEGLIGWDRFQKDGHSSGVTYGVGAGYDVQLRGVVVGLEGEVSDSSIKSCYGDRTYFDPRVCLHADRDLYAGGRIGKVLSPRAMIYAKAGYTNAEIKLSVDDGDFRYRIHDDLSGVRVGAGLEYNLFASAYAKAEYRYSNYQDGFSRNQVVGGFGVRF